MTTPRPGDKIRGSDGIHFVAALHEVIDRHRENEDPEVKAIVSEARTLLAVFRRFERGEATDGERRAAMSGTLSCYSRALAFPNTGIRERDPR